jgi:excisionase family DNA binding protein
VAELLRRDTLLDNDERQVVTVVEAARLLGIGRSLAYEAVARGELPALRIGRRILISKEGLNRLISEGSKEPGARVIS